MSAVVELAECELGYGRSTVYSELNLELHAGRTALLGPNGAGKSTLLAALAGSLKPKRGRIALGTGPAPWGSSRRHYLASVAWVPQATRAYPGLKVREQVAFAGWLKGMSRTDAWDSALGALRTVGLSDLADRASTTLSGGQLRRAGIASALVHDATLILLDEPTVGLDPLQRDQFLEALERLPDTVSVICSTHLLTEITDTYDELVVVDRGQVRTQRSISAVFSDPAGGDAATALRREYEKWVEREQ
ncbi:ATP-binding cassette domain-containing protein [Microbacterium sp. NPDC028030]|uniref:ABC transporter ATP-binding protein n=1 Tax=Microbacterium sp. NPDC028030 TaxID=3155124 RepID=UPI0033C3F255